MSNPPAAALALLLHGSGPFSWIRWEIHPSVLIGCVLLAGMYLVGIGPLRRRYGWAERASPARTAAYLAGVAVIFVALNGPIHDLSDNYLFSAHMVQHMLLMLLMPPLLLLGTPGWLLRPIVRYRAVGAVARVLTRPLVAFAIYNVVFIAWHLPALYNRALESHDLHILQHLMMMAASVIMWWPIVNPLPEMNPIPGPLQLLYLFAFGIPMSIVSALITLSDRVIYPWYEAAPRVTGLSALDDQQLGGLIMWVPGGILFWIAITIVYFRWARAEERADPDEPSLATS